MRKSLLASAILAAIAVPALADSVTVYGQANAAVEYTRTDNGTGSLNQVGVEAAKKVNTPSRFGLKGEEDLGGGLQAYFQMEQSVGLDDASQGSFANREGWVGLKGDFGKFGLGRGKTPYTNVVDVFDGLVDGANSLAIYKMEGNTAIDSNRFNNAVRYDTPNMSGFNAAFMYGFGENKTATTSATNYFSMNGTYTDGPLWLGAAYNDETNLAGVSGAKDQEFLLSGTYKIDSLTFGGGYQYAKVETATSSAKRDAFEGMATYGMGPTTLKAGFIFFGKIKANGGDVANSDFTRYTIGANYAFSKATYTFVEFSGDSVKGAYKSALSPNLQALSVGMHHNF